MSPLAMPPIFNPSWIANQRPTITTGTTEMACSTIAAGIWVVAVAFGIAMPFTGGLLMLAPLVVGVAVPTPGGVGGFHEAFRLGATSFFGADNNTAVGAAIVLHAISVVPVAIGALLFIIQDGLKIGGMARGELG